MQQSFGNLKAAILSEWSVIPLHLTQVSIAEPLTAKQYATHGLHKQNVAYAI